MEVVVGRALELARVFQDHDPLVGEPLGHLQEERVAERRLARPRSAADEHVLVRVDGVAERVPVPGRHHARADVAVEVVDDAGRFPHDEAGTGDEWRDEALEPGAPERALGQFGLDGRRSRSEGVAVESGHGAQKLLDARGPEARVRADLAPRARVESKPAVVGVDVDLGHVVVGEGLDHAGAEVPLHELAVARLTAAALAEHVAAVAASGTRGGLGSSRCGRGRGGLHRVGVAPRLSPGDPMRRGIARPPDTAAPLGALFRLSTGSVPLVA